MVDTVRSYDAIIIGFGKAGKTLAADLAGRNWSVALVERSSHMYGGTCINVGCIPSKTLVESAQLSKRCDGEDNAEAYERAIDRKRRVVSMLRQKNYEKLAKLETVDVYDGVGSFIDSNTVAVSSPDGEEWKLGSEHIFINTGARPIMPDVEGLSDNPYVYTSETLMEETRIPKRLVIIGGGYIGMEFASMYADFGSQVTVLQDGEVFLPREDRDIADAIFDMNKRLGVSIVLGASVRRCEGGLVVYSHHGEESSVTGDAVLVATGRRPNVESLHVENAGVALDDRGAIKVDDCLRTNVPGIWALGDVNGGPQFTFVSLDDYRIVAAQLRGDGYSKADRAAIPYSVFMDTPLSRVGLTERQAREQGLPIRVCSMPAAAIPKAQAIGKTEGMLKVIVHEETGQVIGAALLCAESYEMINTLSLAMRCGVHYSQLRDAMYTHPTMTEAFNELFMQ